MSSTKSPAADSDITLRSAEPTTEDGRAFARYLDQAAEGFFRFLLGRRSEAILAQAFLEPGHDLSFENATFAVCQGQRVGMISAYTAEQHRRSSRRPLEQAAGRSLRVLALSVLGAPLFRVIDTIEDGDFYIQAVAVDPELRGRGVGSRLLDFAEEQARARGCRRLALDVSGANHGASALYLRRGFTIESKWSKRIPIPGVSLLRMTANLG